jgi:hypothetical protein
MRVYYLLVFISFQIPLVSAQVGNEYISRGMTCAGGMPCYQMSKLVIDSDSTLSMIGYGCINKKEWQNFDKWDTEIWKMKIIQKGKFQQLSDISKTDESEHNNYTVKIKRRKILFFWDNYGTEKLKKVAKYKVYCG